MLCRQSVFLRCNFKRLRKVREFRLLALYSSLIISIATFKAWHLGASAILKSSWRTLLQKELLVEWRRNARGPLLTIHIPLAVLAAIFELLLGLFTEQIVNLRVMLRYQHRLAASKWSLAIVMALIMEVFGLVMAMSSKSTVLLLVLRRCRVLRKVHWLAGVLRVQEIVREVFFIEKILPR